MKVRLAEHLGLCYGVRRALELAERSLEEQGDVYTLGDLIHNPQEMRRLRQKGLKTVSSLDEVPQGTVILRTHGSPPSVIEIAKKRGLKVVDATCPHVRAAQKAAMSLAKQGYRVVVVGDPNHPEVQSVVQWAGEGAKVISNAEQAATLVGDKFGVISQTTEQASTVDAVLSELRKKGEVKLVTTICTATQDRQQAVVRLAQKVNTVIVVGGRNSANTRQLARIAGREGAKTYLVEQANEILNSWVAGLTEIGVAAGASTPDWIIKEVVDLLEEMDKTEQPAPEEPKIEQQDQLKPPAVGDIIEARVVSVDNEGAMVDIGYKSEGIVARRELSRKPDVMPQDVVKPGDVIHVMVLALDSGDGAMKLSKRRADEVLAWQNLREAMESGQTVEAPVVEQVKGGLVVDVGLRGFVPASQVERGFASDLTGYVGQTLKLKVIELDKSKNRVILSRRAVLEEEAEMKKRQAWESIHEGDIVKGVVKSITDFGAFVDLGGVDGLLHVSELSWGRIKHPSEVLSVGQEISAKVLRLDPEKGRISLGYKQTLPDPWSQAATKYPEGSIVKGTVTRTAPFGAFVELEDGVEGLVHISELAHRRVQKVEEVVTPGQEVTAKVLHVKPEERRISLSIRQAEPPPPKPQRAARQQHQPQADQPERVTLGDVLGDKLREALSEKKDKERE